MKLNALVLLGFIALSNLAFADGSCTYSVEVSSIKIKNPIMVDETLNINVEANGENFGPRIHFVIEKIRISALNQLIPMKQLIDHEEIDADADDETKSLMLSQSSTMEEITDDYPCNEVDVPRNFKIEIFNNDFITDTFFTEYKNNIHQDVGQTSKMLTFDNAAAQVDVLVTEHSVGDEPAHPQIVRNNR